MDYERLEQLLNDLATPMARFQTARVNVVKQLDTGKPVSTKKLRGALSTAETALMDINSLILDYTYDVHTVQPEESKEDLSAGFDPETMIMEKDGSITR